MDWAEKFLLFSFHWKKYIWNLCHCRERDHWKSMKSKFGTVCLLIQFQISNCEHKSGDGRRSLIHFCFRYAIFKDLFLWLVLLITQVLITSKSPADIPSKVPNCWAIFFGNFDRSWFFFNLGSFGRRTFLIHFSVTFYETYQEVPLKKFLF